jgi:DNA-binding GntR family transcriptional regulator
MTDPTAPFEQVAAGLREQIRSGKLRKGQRVPAIADLVNEYGFSRSTIIRAFNILKADGLNATRQGYGTFVR